MYTVTTVRLTPAQKRRLHEAKQLLEGVEGRKLSHGEAIAAMAEFATRHREVLAEQPSDASAEIEGDPLLDLSLVFNMGRTDARSIDRLLYGQH